MKIKNQNIKKIDKIKRIKRELSFQLKNTICKIYNDKIKENPKYKQSQLINDLQPIIGYLIPANTLSDILKEKVNI